VRAPNRRGHDVAAAARRVAKLAESFLYGSAVACAAKRAQALDLLALGADVRLQYRAVQVCGQRRGLGLAELVHADHGLVAALDAPYAARVGIHEPLLHVAGFDGRDRAAELLDAGKLFVRTGDELGYFCLDRRGAQEKVRVFEQVGLVRHDLLRAQRPLLVPRARQAERLVPRGQLNGAGTCVLREDDAEHLERDADRVVLRLLLGQAERVDLYAVAETPHLLVGHGVAVAPELVPQPDERAHLAHLLDEADAGVTEERDPSEDACERLLGRFPDGRAPRRVRRWRSRS
jgi:hypothetical protein